MTITALTDLRRFARSQAYSNRLTFSVENAGRLVRDIDAELARLQAIVDKQEQSLAYIYSCDRQVGCAQAVAELCDDHLDQSGALLGRVREAAKALAEQEGGGEGSTNENGEHDRR